MWRLWSALACKVFANLRVARGGCGGFSGWSSRLIWRLVVGQWSIGWWFGWRWRTNCCGLWKGLVRIGISNRIWSNNAWPAVVLKSYHGAVQCGGGIRLKSLCILWLAVIGWTVQCKDMGMHWQRREVSKLFSFLAPFFGLSGLCIEWWRIRVWWGCG